MHDGHDPTTTGLLWGLMDRSWHSNAAFPPACSPPHIMSSAGLQKYPTPYIADDGENLQAPTAVHSPTCVPFTARGALPLLCMLQLPSAVNSSCACRRDTLVPTPPSPAAWPKSMSTSPLASVDRPKLAALRRSTQRPCCPHRQARPPADSKQHTVISHEFECQCTSKQMESLQHYSQTTNKAPRTQHKVGNVYLSHQLLPSHIAWKVKHTAQHKTFCSSAPLLGGSDTCMGRLRAAVTCDSVAPGLLLLQPCTANMQLPVQVGCRVDTIIGHSERQFLAVLLQCDTAVT